MQCNNFQVVKRASFFFNDNTGYLFKLNLIQNKFILPIHYADEYWGVARIHRYIYVSQCKKLDRTKCPERWIARI